MIPKAQVKALTLSFIKSSQNPYLTELQPKPGDCSTIMAK
jgi:hypothetical protein